MQRLTPRDPSELGEVNRPPARPERDLPWLQPLLLLAPAGLWLLLLLVLPSLLLLELSLIPGFRLGQAPGAYGIGNYVTLLDPLYLRVVGRSLFYACGTTLLCLLLGFPVAYWITLWLRVAGAVFCYWGLCCRCGRPRCCGPMPGLRFCGLSVYSIPSWAGSIYRGKLGSTARRRFSLG